MAETEEKVEDRKPLLGKALVTWLQLVQQGKVGDVGPKAYNELAALTEEQQVQALEGYSESHGTIRNQSGFLIGIVRRLKRAEGTKRYAREELPQAVQDKIKVLETEDRIDGEAFDKKLVNELGPFPEPKQLEILQTFHDTEKATVNNPVGFIVGIIKRFARSGALGDNKEMPERAKVLLEEAYKNNEHLKEGDLDDRCMRALRNFPPHLAVQLVEDFLKTDLSQVNNPGGFFFGIIKRYERKYHISADGRSDRRGYSHRDSRDRSYQGRDSRDSRDYRSSRDNRDHRDYRERDRDYRDRDDRGGYGYGRGYGHGDRGYYGGGGGGSGGYGDRRGGDYDYRDSDAEWIKRSNDGLYDRKGMLLHDQEDLVHAYVEAGVA